MKSKWSLVFFVTAVAGSAGLAQQSPETARIVERGPNHAVIETVHQVQSLNGVANFKTNRYTELQTGMNRLDSNGSWVPADERIEILQDCAIARGGQHQVTFPSDIQTEAPTITMPGGAKIRTKVLGLSYWDSANNKSVLIAEVKSSQGEVLASGNQVIYQNCFDGDDVSGSILYTYTKAGLIQDIVLGQQLPSPAEWGLNPASTHLECLTEIVEGPQPVMEKQGNAELDDSTLNFGTMQMVPGKAFSLSGETDSVPVRKHWITMEGRNFVVEQVSFETIEPSLKKLPKPQVYNGLVPAHKNAISNRMVPNLRTAKNHGPTHKTLKIAAASEPSSGFVLDYTLLNSATNFTIRGDSTYYVSGPVYFSGTTILEGGSVVKFTNSASITFFGPVNCLATNYHPVSFTSKDDDSIGTIVSGSTGSPTGYYANSALIINSGTNLVNLQNLRINFAQTGITICGGYGHVLGNVQMGNCQFGISATNADYSLRNALFFNMGTNFMGQASTSRVEHLTVDQSYCLAANQTLFATNSLFVGVPNPGNLGSNGVYFASSSNGVFQTVGAGTHYLATNSPYRDLGVSGINPALSVSLKTLTTYPPVPNNSVYYSNVILAPVVQRDTNQPDIGYHYYPVDYMCQLFEMTNAVLTLTNGVVIGSYYDSALWIADGSDIISQGSPKSPNRFVEYTTVQEQAWKIGSNTLCFINPWRSNSKGKSAQLSFTEFWHMAESGGYSLYCDNSSWLYTNLTVRNCSFFCGGPQLIGDSSDQMEFKNNLFERSGAFIATMATAGIYNNLFFDCSVGFECDVSNTWTLRDNAFDSADVQDFSSTPITHDHNAYINSSTASFPTNYGDVVLSSMAYEVGPLGKYYQPTSSSLINVGSRSASDAGLYHYTVLANQTKETNSTVDIGFHYVALDANGNPVDTDSDGVPDYLADANGNGIVDAGEIPWAIAPTITSQPSSVTVTQGASATFSVAANGSSPLNYQWYYNSTVILGATSSSYTVYNAQTTNAGNYCVVISNMVGGVTSTNASLTVNVPPSITQQPASQSVTQGSNATFTVTASGTSPLHYQWYFNTTNAISGAITNSYTLTNAQSGNAGSYSVVVTNIAGSVRSSNAVLTVNVPPSITAQPTNQTVMHGSNAVFSVTASGTAPLSYQWRFNTTNISGAISNVYTLTNAQAGNAGSYSVVVTNIAGTVTSSNAVLTVN